MTITLTIEEMLALFGLFSGGFTIAVWIGSKLFATRKDLHEVKNSLTAVSLTLSLQNNDLAWIKGALGHPTNGGN